MSKVSYIHGIPQGIAQNEMRDRAKALPARSFVDYSAMTDGEMKLVLAYEQFRILSAYYPEASEARRSAELLKDALFMGLHGPKNRLSGTDQAQVRRLIDQARSRTAPAAFVIDGRASLLQGIGDIIDRDTPPIVNDWGSNGNGTGSAIDATLPPMPGFSQKDCGKRGGIFASKEQKEAFDLCEQQNQYVKLLNEKLEKSGHHILYSFNDKPNQSPQVVTVKTVNHRAAIEKWNEITGLSVDNIRNWIRVGIMRNNARVGVEPYQPEKTIEVFRDGVIAKNQQQGLGEPLTIAAIVAIISAITAAAGATAALINSLSARDSLRFKSSLGDMGLPSFGPEEGDYLGTGGAGITAGGFDYKDLIIPGALAAGAYFLLKED